MENRDFKGIWIPKEIWLAENLSLNEKILLVEIDSLSRNGQCFASNGYFAQFMGVSTTRISDLIATLKKLGYVEQVSFDGVTRVLSSRLKYGVYPEIGSTPPLKKTSIPSRRKLQDPLEENFKYNNTVNNTTNNTQKQGKTSSSESKQDSKLFSTPRKDIAGQKKRDKWLTEKITVLEEFSFDKDVYELLMQFLNMLADMNSFLQDISIRSQLEKISKISSDSKKKEVIKNTITRGWKSLDYAADDSGKKGNQSFDTAKSSSNQFKDPSKDTRYKNYERQEVF